MPGLRSLYLAKAGTPECEGVLVRPFSRDDLVEKLIVATVQHSSTLQV